MNDNIRKKLPHFLSTLGIAAQPMGIFYTDEKPAEGSAPEPGELPTREKEMKNKIDWQKVFGQFSCVMSHIWRARKNQGVAYFSSEQFGCPGGAFWLGFNKPQPETVISHVSTGLANHNDGELYCDSPDRLRRIFEYVDPRPAPKKYCVVKPISKFSDNENPELITFFTRPESLSGLHQLATFVTNDPEVVVSPWAAACGSIVIWPLHYLSKGQNKAVIGGWDPSARKFFKTDELSFTIAFAMFKDMLDCYNESFLTTNTWQTVQKKIARSNKIWN